MSSLRAIEPGSPPVARTAADVSLLRLLNVILQYRSLVLACSLLLFTVVVVITLVLPRTYTATTSFTPQADKLPANLAGIAAQFGLTLPTADAALSPDFYVGLLGSRRILGDVIETRYTFATDTGIASGTLVDVFKIKADTKAKQHAKALRRMKNVVFAKVDRPTGVVTIAVETRNPELSARVAERLLELVNQFNLQTRQSHAASERRFTERRLAEAKQELLEAENRQQRFLEINREFHNSPVLNFQQERLEREVGLRQSVVTALSQAYDKSRIDEARDVPVITVVEQPDPPALPDPRGVLVKGILALVAGSILGCLLAFALASLRASRATDVEEFEHFRTLKHAAVQDLRHPWRLLGSLIGGRGPGRSS